jgi:hypothetical protein
MIPGNRPEDEWHEKFIEALTVPDDLVLVMDPGVLASALNVTMAFLSAANAEAFKQGKAEREMTPLGEQCGALEPEMYVICQRQRGHHGDHHWSGIRSPDAEDPSEGHDQEVWWQQ